MSAPPPVVDGVPAEEQREKELCTASAVGVPAVDDPSGGLQEKPLTEASLNQSNADAETCSASANTASKMATGPKVFASPEPACVPEVMEAGGGGEKHSAACGVEAAMEVSTVSEQPSLSLAGSPVLEEDIPGAAISAAVSMDTAVKTAETIIVPADNVTGDTGAAMAVLEEGGEGVNVAVSSNTDIAPPAQQRRDSSSNVVSDPSKGRNVGSYASVLGSRTKEGGGGVGGSGGHMVRRFGGGLVGGYRRRNVVQLRWEGGGTPLTRGRVAELILEMGFTAPDIFALICPSGSYEFDLSFMKPEGLDIFWERYRRCRDLPQWKGLVPKVISRQPLIKLVTILVRNESIPEADLVVWLRRYGDVLTPLRKVLDQHGIWTGAWTVSLQLRVMGNVVQHLPCSAFLGRDRLTVFYQGQPKVCNKCGEKGHFAASCTLMKCSLCQDLGHLARECSQIRCNLCQQLGHPYSQCPEALHNLPGLEAELRRLDEEDEAADVREEASVAPSVSVPSVELDSVSPSIVISESVPPVSVPVPPVRRSSRLAEAAGGAGLADLGSQPPVPLPRRNRRSQQNVGVPDEDKGRVPLSHASPSPEGVPIEEGWECVQGKRKKKRMRRAVLSASESDPGGVPLENTFSVLSGDELDSDLSISLSSMDGGGESHGLKRPVSGDESVVEVKRQLPQSS